MSKISSRFLLVVRDYKLERAWARSKTLDKLCRQVFQNDDLSFKKIVQEIQRENNVSIRQAYRRGFQLLQEMMVYEEHQ